MLFPEGQGGMKETFGNSGGEGGFISGPAQQDFEWGGSSVSQILFFGGGGGGGGGMQPCEN